MENETPDKPASKKPIFIICLSFIIVFIICYSIMMLLGPGRKLAAIKSEYGFVQDKKNKTDERIISDSAYLALLKERSFLQSRIAMAATDSIYLAISFPDSVISLEISGVTVHTTKILKSKSSRILKRNEFEILSMLARPFTITNNYASIKKEPLMIKMAPKDTSEFQPDIIPDTADFEPVNFILQTDIGTRIIVYQEEKIRYGDGIRLFMFDLWFRIKDTLRSIKSVMLFRIPEYHPSIRLRIHRSDAKIIYRALPEHGQIGVYM
jgi:hypothetical protein